MKELIHQYGAWIVFALVFLESIGLPLPGEAVLVSAAIFAGTTQELGIALVLLSAVLGAILGSTIGFWIGDRYGYPLLLRYGSNIGLTETRIKIAQYLFRRQGMVVVLIARFVAVLRSVDVHRFEPAPNDAAGLGWRTLMTGFGPLCMAHSLVVGVKCSVRHSNDKTGDDSEHSVAVFFETHRLLCVALINP